MDDVTVECTITYVGMDTLEHQQEFNGSQTQLDKLLVFLEEHGAHCISIDLDD